MIARLSMRHAVMRHVLVALVALAMIGIARPAAAQGAAPSARPPSPAAILLAKQILELKGVKDVFVPLVRGVVIKTRDMFMQTNFMWSKDLNEAAVIVEKQYDSRISELVDASARIYASHFTEQELRDLLTFYQSPLGRKAIVEEPKAENESLSAAGAWADNVSQDVVNSMRVEMKKRGHDM
jgi:hypothetical protein